MTGTSLLVRLAFTVTVILAFVSLILVPAPFKSQLFGPRLRPQYYTLAANAKEVGKTTLYSGTGEREKRSLLVWFAGGEFLCCDRRASYGLLNQISANLTDFDVLVFDYPVRFGHTLHETMLAINDVLADKTLGRYDDYYAGGMSAGAFLMGTFQAKETRSTVADRIRVAAIGIRFKAMVVVCGLYSCDFDAGLLNAMFRFYVTRGTPAAELYGCYGLVDTPKLVIGATTDWLYPQTCRFLTSEPCDSKVYVNDLLRHEFPLLNNCPEARDAVERIGEFIRKIVTQKVE